jgi:uncharacterized membrane protein
MAPPNNWEIEKCLRLSLAILLATLGLVGLAALGLDVPILRQIVCFIFLSFIPGILILRILKIHNVGVIESLVYAVGSSVAFVYVAGLFANFILPLIGVSKPISTLPVTATLAIFTLILGVLAYRRDRGFAGEPKQCNIMKYLSPPYLLLLVLPFLAIFGARLVNTHQNNLLLLLFIVAVACVIGMVALDRLPKNAYPLAITMIAIGLLFHLSLISPTLYGSDISVEYYFQHIVLQNGFWDPTIPNNYNTCLSIVLLSPIYSLMLNIDATWIFKVIYPLFFSLVPLILFHAFRRQVGARKALLAAFVFLSTPLLISTMVTPLRQAIAEVFIALVILLMVDRKLALNQRVALTILFSMSLIMSHYALAYIFLALLLVGWPITALIRSRTGKRAWGRLIHKFGGLPESITSQGAFPHKIMTIVVCVYLAFTIGWYGGIAQGTALYTMRDIAHWTQLTVLNTIRRIEKQYLPLATESTERGIGEKQYSLLTLGPTEPPPNTQLFESPDMEVTIKIGLGYDFWEATGLVKASRIFQYIIELLIIIGFFWMIFRPQRFKFRPEFVGLTVAVALILLALILLPRVSASFGFLRVYHIGLFLFAPLCILGGQAVWQGGAKLFSFPSRPKSEKGPGDPPPQEAPSVPRYSKHNPFHHREPKAKQSQATAGSKRNSSNSLRFLALAVLIPYFLFTSGFIYAFSSQPASIALGPYKMDWYALHNQNEVAAAAWLAQNLPNDAIVYADATGSLLLDQQLYGRVYDIPPSGDVPKDAYIFLRTWNLEYNEILVPAFQGFDHVYVPVNLMNRPALAGRLDDSQVVYDNAGAKVLAPVDCD